MLKGETSGQEGGPTPWFIGTFEQKLSKTDGKGQETPLGIPGREDPTLGRNRPKTAKTAQNGQNCQK